jgi:hypothetical protein
VGYVVGHDDALTIVRPWQDFAGSLSGKSGSGFSVRKRDPARPGYPKILKGAAARPPGVRLII